LRVTNLLILICVLVSFYLWFSPGRLIEKYLGFSVVNLFSGKFWVLVTSLFIHQDLTHLIGNMIFLFVFGNTLERSFGSSKVLCVFLVGGVLSSLFSIPFYSKHTLMIGASAAIFTLTSVAMLTKPLKFSILFLMPVGLVAILYFIYNLIAVYYGFQGNVAYTSHVVGFLIGVPLGVAWSPTWKRNLAITILLLAIYGVVMWILLNVLNIMMWF